MCSRFLWGNNSFTGAETGSNTHSRCCRPANTVTHSRLPLSLWGLRVLPPLAADVSLCKLLLPHVANHWKPSSPGRTTWVPTILTKHTTTPGEKSKRLVGKLGNVPKMREASGPLLTLLLQPPEDPSPGASPLVQLFVDLFKHLLHLPRCCFVKLLWERRTKKKKNSSIHLHMDWASQRCGFSVCSWVQITNASLFISAVCECLCS